MSEKHIKTYGERGSRVRVCRLATAIGTRLIRVEWREQGKKRRESWPDTRENERTAKAYAEGTSARLVQKRGGPKAPITLVELVRKYRLAHADQWRPATMLNRMYRLGKFLTFAGENFRAQDVDADMVDEFRGALRTLPLDKTGKPMVPNQAAACASEVKALLRFGKVRKHLDHNPLAEYVITLAKDEVREETHEYTNDEWARILAKFDPKSPTYWRAYCLILLAGTLGPRQRALCHLEWSDVSSLDRELTWRKALDKMGKKRDQPLPRDAVRAFRIAAVWRRRDGYQGKWIFYAPLKGTRAKKPGDKPYSYQSLNYQLHRAERASGVASIPFRAMHGFRRTAAGNVYGLTGGDLKAAGDWIGDTDLKSLQKYLKRRDDTQRNVAAMVSAPPEPVEPVPTERPTEPKTAETAGGKS